MERGTPDQTVYTFEVPEGRIMRYPDAELWTRDYNEADAYAREMGYMLIANEYEFEDSGLVEDYTPKIRCAHCDDLIDLEDAGLWIASDGNLDPADERRVCDESPDHLHHPNESS